MHMKKEKQSKLPKYPKAKVKEKENQNLHVSLAQDTSPFEFCLCSACTRQVWIFEMTANIAELMHNAY